MRARPSRRPPLATLARRWLAVAAVVLIGYAYYQPLRSWFETRDALSSRRAQVEELAAKRHELEARLRASASPEALAREARRLGFVRPGEHLFIVKGIAAWKKAHTTIDGDGE
jgi:cell division protein FtsB